MSSLEQVLETMTPVLVERVVREIVATRDADEPPAVPVEVIADRILDDAHLAATGAQRIRAVEALLPKIEQQIGLIHGMRFFKND